GDRTGETAVVDGDKLLDVIRGTLVDRQLGLRDLHVDADPDAHIEVDLVENVALVEIRQQEGRPTPAWSHVVVRGAGGVRVAIDVAGRELLVRAVVRVQSQADLLE